MCGCVCACGVCVCACVGIVFKGIVQDGSPSYCYFVCGCGLEVCPGTLWYVSLPVCSFCV